ncbi:MAG: hypothetical protein HUJ76_13195 [Parasporobacterium sp.]|nr:hypothetical protein [Parasporobacterium sp.]
MKENTNYTELNERIKLLEAENAYLKRLLEQAGIPYAYVAAGPDTNTAFSPAITVEHARLFFSYFWGRMDVYAKRSENRKTGKAGYFPQCNNFWRYGVCPKAEGARVKCMV